MMLPTFLYLFIAGLVGGFIAGLVGIGGGVVYVFIIPIALYHLGIPEQEMAQYIIANSIFAILFASATTNIILYRNKLFYKKEVLTIAALSTIVSILTLHYIVNTHWYSMALFNGIIVIVLSFMLYSTLKSARQVHITPLKALTEWKLCLVGIAGGTIAALSGLGGGIVIIPLLNSIMRIDIKKASAISSGVIMITAIVMTIFNLNAAPLHSYSGYNTGYIIFPIALTLTVGVIIASPLGVKTANRLSCSTISYVYSLFLLIVIVNKFVELFKSAA